MPTIMKWSPGHPQAAPPPSEGIYADNQRPGVQVGPGDTEGPEALLLEGELITGLHDGRADSQQS